jgi:hypothetical protein
MQGVSGRQGGGGSPLNPFVAPSAVPNTTNKNPSMIFLFTCLSSAAGSGLARILSEDQPRKALKECLSCLPHFLSATPKRQVRSYYLGMHTVSGRQGGIGSPLNPFAAPSAVPNTTNKNPIMIFAFMCASPDRSSGFGTDSKRRSAPQGP